MNKGTLGKPTLSHVLGLDSTGVFGILLAIFWTSNNLVYFARGLVSRIMGESVAVFFIPTIYIFFGFLSLPYIIKKIKIRDSLLYVAVVVYFFACYSLYPENTPYLNTVQTLFLAYCLPAFFVGLALDYKNCERVLYVASLAAIIFTTLSSLLGGSAIGQGYEEDMYRAYSLLAPVLMIIWRYFEYIKLLDMIVMIIGVISIFSMGARGPLVCVFIFGILYLLFFKQFKNKLLSYGILTTLLISVILFFNKILMLLNAITLGLGLSNRISSYFSMGEIYESSGRDVIFANVLAKAKSGPFWGRGFCADRLYTEFYNTDTYSHNIALEMWSSFGMVLGSIILVLILFGFIWAVRKSQDNHEKRFILTMFVAGVCSLLFSSSFVMSNMFFMAIGVFISTIRHN